MPQATDRLRAIFHHEEGPDAETILRDAGWREVEFCTWSTPPGERPQIEWDALDYLIQEWDHAYCGSAATT